MLLSSYINKVFQSKLVHFSPLWSISLYLVCVCVCFFFLIFFLVVYWLKHIFRSITSEASVKSIIAPFFADNIWENFDGFISSSTWNHNAPLFHIWSLFFFFSINITLNMKMRNLSWLYFPMPLFFIVKWLKKKKNG